MTNELQILVKMIAINNKTIVNIMPDIPEKIGERTAFKNAVMPVASFVRTLPNKIADVQRKKVAQAKSLPITSFNFNTGPSSNSNRVKIHVSTNGITKEF